MHYVLIQVAQLRVRDSKREGEVENVLMYAKKKEKIWKGYRQG